MAMSGEAMQSRTHTHDGRPRIVATGGGLVTPLGIGIEPTWEALMAGRSGAGPITRFDASEFRVQFACQVDDFDPADWMDAREARRLDRMNQFALVASRQALDQAGLVTPPSDPTRCGVVVGTGVGGFETIQVGFESLVARGPNRVNPLTGAMMLPDMAAGQVSMAHGFLGPNLCVVTACATGSNAIGEAWEILRRGDADLMLAGAAEAGITPFALAAFHRTGAMSTRNEAPQQASRPFDRDRDGFVFGEGAGMLVLETMQHALARGARPLAELAGYGLSADAHHVSAPLEDGSGAARAMQMALDKAGLGPDGIDHINAHGTGTVLNDLSETRAIHRVFGDEAGRLSVSATKSMHGHLMGAAGGVEAVIAIETMRRGILPPTINLDHPGDECDLDYVPLIARPAAAPIRAALSNSFGFGGHNASLLFRRIQD
jgi:3-oxoacyl-[acyl-carrier-protein] synthase II